MELGNWALISSPSLLALLPLIIFIVFALLGKGNYLGMFLGIIVGFFLTGQDLVSLTNAYTAAISSSTTVIGLLIMFGTGLGVLMTEARITHTLVYWIVKRIGINTRAKGKIVLILSSILSAGCWGLWPAETPSSLPSRSRFWLLWASPPLWWLSYSRYLAKSA